MTGVAIQRAHAMPFGAEVRPNGQVVFRLWAPGARRVNLRLDSKQGASRTLALESVADGWYESSVDDVPPGTLYSFQPDEKRWLPDPASRFQPGGVHGASEVIDPGAYWWHDAGWEGRPWSP